MKISPSVAGIVVHHAQPQLTQLAVMSLLAESVVQRVYLVDNATAHDWSTLATDRRVVVLASAVNRGFTGGNNIGCTRAGADGFTYFALLNSDAVVAGECVTKLVHRLEQADAAIAVPKILRRGEQLAGGDGSDELIESCGGALTAGRVARIGEGEPDRHHLSSQFVDWAPGAMFVVQNAAWRQIGGFDERYFLYYEDVDLSLRLATHGHRIVTEPTAVALHGERPVAQRQQQRLGTLYYGTRNRLLLGRAHRRRLGLLAPCRTAWSLSKRLGDLTLRRRWSELAVVWRGVRDHFRGNYGDRNVGLVCGRTRSGQ